MHTPTHTEAQAAQLDAEWRAALDADRDERTATRPPVPPLAPGQRTEASKLLARMGITKDAECSRHSRPDSTPPALGARLLVELAFAKLDVPIPAKVDA